jgi:uncharacterized damage-inducible protein DinB
MTTEAWLSGPIPGIDPLLLPAAHALVQARTDILAAASTLGAVQLWAKPGGAASVAFHVFHVAGSIDRLLTYARGEQLDDAQRKVLEEERKVGAFTWHAERPQATPHSHAELLRGVTTSIEDALTTLGATDAATLHSPRLVGRAGLPSTVFGLLFHVAEHTQRHTGQIVTTAKIVRGLLPADVADVRG